MTLIKKRWLLDFAFSAFGDRPVAEITARELLALLREIEGRGLYETARRLRSTCGMVFRYAIATGRAERDPSVDLRGALTTHQVSHRATIVDPAGIGALLRAIDGFDGQPTTRAALRLAAYVFVRPGELRHAEWKEFDLDAAVWSIPAEKMKMRRPHRVPLARQSLAILRRSEGDHGQRALALPIRTHGRATDLREHFERCAAPTRLRFRGNEHARFPGHGGHPAERNGSLEPGCHRAATRAPGGERRTARLHPRRGILVRTRCDDAGVGGLSRRASRRREGGAAR